MSQKHPQANTVVATRGLRSGSETRRCDRRAGIRARRVGRACRFQAGGGERQRLYGSVDLHLSPEGHDLLELLLEPIIAARLSRPVQPVPAFFGIPE